MKNIKILGAVAVLVGLLASCTGYKKVPYIVDAELIPADVLAQPMVAAEPVIQPGDLLNIQVTGSNMQAVAPFNKGSYIDESGRAVMRQNNNYNAGEGSNASTDYYLVDRAGNISIPIIGDLHVEGCTKSEVAQLVCDAIYPKYLREKPVVDVRFMNFRVTVLGAVKAPGIKVSQNERLNLFEALAMAGDMEITGDRENVLLVRTLPTGAREIHKLNFQDKNLLMSPYYNLQPNDMLIVNYNRSGAQRTESMNNTFTNTMTVVGGAGSVLALILSIISLTK